MISHLEYVTAVRGEGEALLAAGRMGVEAAVPTCPGWSVADLLIHVGRVYRWSAAALRAADPEQPPDYPARPQPADDPRAFCAAGLDVVVAALKETPPDRPAWNWSAGSRTAGFWARRLAHESLVHRWDAQNAHGFAQRVDPDLACDGLDELVDLIAPELVRRDSVTPPEGVLAAAATDSCWRRTVRIGPAGIEASDDPPDVELTGTAPRLLLVLYGRLPADAVQVSGRAELLAAWRAGMRF